MKESSDNRLKKYLDDEEASDSGQGGRRGKGTRGDRAMMRDKRGNEAYTSRL